MLRLFLSYAKPDRPFAERLARSLVGLGYHVWFDCWEICAGALLTTKLDQGLASSDHLLVVLSPAALASVWVERELAVALYDEIVHRTERVIPLIVADCSPPPLLRAKRSIDFRGNFEVGFAQLAVELHVLCQVSPSIRRSMASTAVASTHSPLSDAQSTLYTPSMGYKAARLSEINVELSLPYIGKVSGIWKPDEAEQRAAWELYVELVTRISTIELQPNEGMLRESLTSLYDIFTTTRKLLRSYGPTIARPTTEDGLSLGIIAVHVLNYVLRPVLAVWHPRLSDYEHQRESHVSAWENEQRWDKAQELRRVLAETSQSLTQYTNLLAQVAGVPELIRN